MAVGYGEACPKPERGEDRITRRRAREAQAQRFRQAVWLNAMQPAVDGGTYAYCAVCGRGPLLRTRDVLHPLAGHVAHNRGRRVAPADKYNPDAATLQCSRCHLASHSMRFA